MTNSKKPKLRNVDKYKCPYPLNKFPEDFPKLLGKEVIYLLATKSRPSLEGEEWEEIFANCIRATWKPSNIGLDDVIFGACAWGAKTVKSNSISKQTNVRLISGRNSLVYSYNDKLDTTLNPNPIGEKVLGIWNERVSSIMETYKNLRTIVLLKSEDLTELGVFEFNTEQFQTSEYYWEWNKNTNLVGFDKKTKSHKFTWQPHGSQFTIIEPVPNDLLIINIQKPPDLSRDIIFNAMNYSDDWVTYKHRND